MSTTTDIRGTESNNKNCDCDEDPSYSVKILSLPRPTSTTETMTATTTISIPALAFGLYKVPQGDEGVKIITDAILEAGYRHLDSASIYGNERTVGKALASVTTHFNGTNGTDSTSTDVDGVVKRSELFVASKVWNDAQRKGRTAVRESVLKSLRDLGLDYLDLCYVHWPVPGCFVDTYRELLVLQSEGTIKHLGISNFRMADYEELTENISPETFVKPIVNQFEVSPYMYRPRVIQYFQQEKGILVAASKALNRAANLDEENSVLRQIAASHSGASIGASTTTTVIVTPAQVLLRWSFQKGLIVLAKTSSLPRMKENRALFGFSLSAKEMEQLDAITTKEIVEAREELEAQRRTS